MANNNVQNVRFLRNGSLYGTREAALTGLNGQTLAAEQDGSIILARYGSGNQVKTLVGLVYVSGGNKSLTIFDIDGAAADVEALRNEINGKLGTTFISSGNTVEANLSALSGNSQSTSAETSVEGAKRYAEDLISTLDVTDTAVDGSYVSQVTEADGKISVSRVALPTASTVSGESKVVIDVTQDKGAITATAANITGVKLAGYTEGTDADIAATDTLGEALGKLQAQINAMDKSATTVDGQVVITVTETDGKVSETKENVKNLQLGGYEKDTTATGDIASTDTINTALSKLENKAAAITIGNEDGSINVTNATSGTDINVNIQSGEKVLAKDGNAGLYTDIAVSAVTGTELTNLGTNVKEAYKLVGLNKNEHLGEYIKIYKDSALINFYLGHVDDTLTDADASGESTTTDVTNGTGDTALVYIMQLANGKYKLAAVNVESFLQESEFASGVTADSSTHIVHGVVDPNSEKDESNNTFLTVGTDGFKISGIKDAIDTKINKLDVEVINPGAGKYIYAIEENDGKISASGANVSDAVLNGYSKGSDSGAVVSTDTVNQAISKLENQIDSKVDALDATESGETSDGKVNVKVTQINGKITAVDVVGTDIASDSALTAEIAARKAVDGQNGQTYDANASSSYISGATSLNDADVKLDAALKALDDDAIKSVSVNNKTLIETNGAVGINISAVPGSGSTEAAIEVKTANNGDVTLQINYIDAGTYDID